jgi:nitrogen fixation protein NifB
MMGLAHGRIHLPVSPVCNICCRFCVRGFSVLPVWSEQEVSEVSSRDPKENPGWAAEVLSYDGALCVLEKALSICPDITVVGIAGPGDPLATRDAIEVFEDVHRNYPELIKCISTNGLMLPMYADDLEKVGVTSISVTINAISPEILKKIVSKITYEDVVYNNDERGAEILIQNQLRGIRLVSDFAVVKVNTVLIPGVNDSHIGDIAKAVSDAGAKIFNIIPLIPQGEFSAYSPPNCIELSMARMEAERYLSVFRYCKRCRADACGIPGISEYASALYGSSVKTFSHG